MNFNRQYMDVALTCIDCGYKAPDLHRWGPGIRDLYALHYVISGKGFFETNNHTYSLKAGDSFLIFPYTEVCYYPDQEDPWEYIWVDFKGEEAKELLSFTSLIPQHPVAEEAPQNLETLFHIAGATGRSQFEAVRVNAKLRLLLSYYMEHYPRLEPAPQTNYAIAAKEYIEQNYWKSNLTVSDVVDFVKIERTYLFRLFKEATGMSLQSYLISYRVHRSCTLLKTTDLSIKSIACSVGYRDQMYFSKIFKKVTSYSPTEYISKHSVTTDQE